MSSLEFEYTRESGDELGVPEHRHTMARLEVRVGDTPITRVFDNRAQTVRDAVYVPLYPLAEWLATHWFALLHENDGADRTLVEQRHLLNLGAEGFAFPRLSIVPEGDKIRLVWHGGAVPYTELRFIESGEDRLPLRVVRDRLLALMHATVQQLPDDAAPTPLQAELEALNALTDEEREFCEAAGALGLDPFSIDDEDDKKILDIAGALPKAVHQDFFASATWPRIDEHFDWVRESIRLVTESAPEGAPDEIRRRVLDSLREDRPSEPWTVGYRCAREVRNELGVRDEPLAADELDPLGWRATQDIALRSGVFDAVATRHPGSGEGKFAVSSRHPQSRRFVFARALFEYVTAPEFPRLVTRAVTYAQQESRAFAAELLAPAGALRERIEGDRVGMEKIAELADEFDVSSMVIEHQLENHGIARACC